MDLPENLKSFEFDHVGNDTGYEFKGTFKVVCILNMGQKRQLEVEKTMLQADLSNPTDGLSGISFILANLRVRIQDGPEWWKQSAGGSLIIDEDALVALYDKVMEAETEWREKVKKKGEESKKSEASEAS